MPTSHSEPRNPIDRVAALPEPYRSAGLSLMAKLCDLNAETDDWRGALDAAADAVEAEYLSDFEGFDG